MRMLLIKYYENAKDNVALASCIDVMAQLMLKYGSKVLEQQEQNLFEKKFVKIFWINKTFRKQFDL